MKLFLSYLKSKLLTILLICLCAVIFAAVFSLYELPMEAVWYAAALCLCAGLTFLAFGFLRYRRKHAALCSLFDRITLSAEELPTPGYALEQDYQALLRTVREDRIRIVSETDAARAYMADYYTLWAHQIKTPIAAMRLLLQSGETDALELEAELFSIEQYVDMVLQYMRLESDTTDYVIKEYSLDRIVKQAVRKYAKLFIRKKLALDYDGTDVTVLTDEKWLQFVIEQILSNSLKYTKEGRIAIRVEPEKTLVISDTGIGIAPEDLPRVFDRGFTGYNGRSDKKSTGIGLYLCRSTLTKLGHTIRMDSEIGAGTMVRIGLKSTRIEVE